MLQEDYFSPGTSVSSTNKTDHHDIAESDIVTLTTINRHVLIQLFETAKSDNFFLHLFDQCIFFIKSGDRKLKKNNSKKKQGTLPLKVK